MTAAAPSMTIEQAALQTVNLGEHFQVTPAGLVVIGNPSFNAFDSLGETLRTLDHSLQFTVGDFFREVEKRFGDESGLPLDQQRASQILDHTGWSEATLRTYRWTSEKVPQAVRRMDVLTYSHHQAVGKLSPKDQKKWLTQAAAGNGEGQPWSVNRLKAAIKAGVDVDTRTRRWLVLVDCGSEKQQRAIIREFEGRGLRCKAIESSKSAGSTK